MRDVEANLVIGSSFVQPELHTCKVEAGDIFVAKIPDKFYITFESKGAGAAFFLQFKYVKDQVVQNYSNDYRCTLNGQKEAQETTLDSGEIDTPPVVEVEEQQEQKKVTLIPLSDASFRNKMEKQQKSRRMLTENRGNMACQ